MFFIKNPNGAVDNHYNFKNSFSYVYTAIFFQKVVRSSYLTHCLLHT